MQTTIDGVTITLTDEQVQHIREAKATPRNNLTSFEEVLLGFGFRKWKETNNTLINHYGHLTKGWWAEICNGKYVWVVGSGLRDCGIFPGGYMYYTPEELIEELEKQL